MTIDLPSIISRDEARALGLKRFFTGKPCKRGHVAERWACGGGGGECVECSLENGRKYRAADPERTRENARKWRAANLEMARERDRLCYAKNKDRILSQKAAKRAANKDEINKRQAAQRRAGRAGSELKRSRTGRLVIEGNH